MATDLLFAFDTTGSMSPAIHEVRLGLHAVISQMYASVPDLRIGLIAHGDYCDDPKIRLQRMTLSAYPGMVLDFVRHARNTNGGDNPEMYEEVLHQARQPFFDWRPEARKVLVMIGDDEPHASLPGNSIRNWRLELAELVKLGIQVTAVQCLKHTYGYRSRVNEFWPELPAWAGAPTWSWRSSPTSWS